ncbi:Gfo/Idh/MocA family oxidoreductase [Chelativorans sp. ZYF759]|uniref:Gfo/Idh/MocA family protein n=1 Tax=Chelativorans sp. ZYF759 TaxID=2692213 RepID=UPI00145D9AFC|nr:Gfo/Idh/MocA family oxidoreductase [Chelativorans sp. ZYF759]NMG41683.1 Gfo/Idh/MocA family oxidoreductase [Chelativorans sp. ZYF759]
MTRKLRVGVVGASPTGSWGTAAHLPALAALDGLFEVTAISTAHMETATESARRFGIRHAFADARALAEHPDVDIVTVAVRVPAHGEVVSAALAAGKHVYCEWPLGRTTVEAQEMLAAAQSAGVVHMVGLQARRAPAIEHARDLIARGRIGDVKAANLVHSVPWMFSGREGSAYLLDRDSGAHFLSIPGGHSIDVLCHLLGDFMSVSATLARVGDDGVERQFERPSWDQAVIGAILRTGAVVGVRLQGASPIGGGVRLEISGSKGDLVISTEAGGRGIQMADLRLQGTTSPGTFEDIEIPRSYLPVPPGIRSGAPLNVAKAYRALHGVIVSGAAASPGFADAIALHRTLDAIELSHAEGRRVVLGN